MHRFLCCALLLYAHQTEQPADTVHVGQVTLHLIYCIALPQPQGSSLTTLPIRIPPQSSTPSIPWARTPCKVPQVLLHSDVLNVRKPCCTSNSSVLQHIFYFFLTAICIKTNKNVFLCSNLLEQFRNQLLFVFFEFPQNQKY